MNASTPINTTVPLPPYRRLPDSIDSLSEASSFLRALDPTGESYCYRTYSDAKPKPFPDTLAAKYSGSFERNWCFLAAQNCRGAGVCVVINRGGQASAEISEIRAIFVDLDGAPIGPAWGCALQPSIVVETSCGRYHCYWLTDGSVPTSVFSQLQKSVAKRFGGDPNVFNLDRVMRLPGFWHQKGEPIQSLLRHCDPKLRYSLQQLLQEFPQEAVETTVTISSPNSIVSEVADIVIADLRSALAHLSSELYSDWIDIGCALHSLAEIGLGLWLEWSARSAKFDLSFALTKWQTFHSDRTSYKAVFAKAQRAGWSGRSVTIFNGAPLPIQSKRSFRSAKDLLADMAPIPWIVEDYLVKNTLTVVFGRPGCCKTFLALDWACCVATGTDWCGMPVAAGAVFIIVGEGYAGIRRRLHAWQMETNVDLSNAPLYVSDGAVMLTDPLNAAWVKAECDRLSKLNNVIPALIVVDTLARNYGGDENDAADMGVFISNLDEFLKTPFESCVLVIHHTGAADDAQHRSRGSSALPAAVDCEFSIKRNGEQITLESKKAKDWDEPEPTHFTLRKVTWTTDANVFSSCVLDKSAATLTAGMKNAGKNMRKVYARLKLLIQQKTAMDETCLPIPLEELREIVMTEKILKDRSRWHEVIKSMAARGVIRLEGDFIALLGQWTE